MKIVRIIARLNVGGPARHVVWLSEALKDGEFDSVLIAGKVPEGEEDMSYFAEEHGITPIFIEEMSRELSLGDIVSLWKVYSQLRKEEPDVIHTHTAKAGTIGRTAGFFYRWATLGTLMASPRSVKIIHTFHGHVFHSYYGRLKTQAFLLIERVLARFATDKIVVISGQQREEINGKFCVGRKSQFEVVPLGLDLREFDGWREHRNLLRDELNANDGSVLVGLVGRLTEVKNHRLFLNVVSKWASASSDIRFVIIGDGHLKNELENEAERLGVSSQVTFLGNRADPDVFYAGLDIVALTSLNEGTPLSLIEAMACEKPVISTNVGGVSDLLGDVEDDHGDFKIRTRGVTVESEDETGFCAGLKHLIENERLRSDLAAKGKEFVSEKHSKARLVRDIKRLYRGLHES